MLLLAVAAIAAGVFLALLLLGLCCLAVAGQADRRMRRDVHTTDPRWWGSE